MVADEIRFIAYFAVAVVKLKIANGNPVVGPGNEFGKISIIFRGSVQLGNDVNNDAIVLNVKNHSDRF